MSEAIIVRTPDELIASIPHTLGFKPSESMVCLPFGGGPVARLDLPQSADEVEPFVQTLAEVYLLRYHPERLALVAYGEDGQHTVEALASLASALQDGPTIAPILWVKDEEWTELITGTRGTISSSVTARIEAEFAVRGRVMPNTGRDDLATALQGDPTPVGTHLPAALDRFRNMTAPERQQEATWVAEQVEVFLVERRYLADAQAARILTAVTDRSVRDVAMLNIQRTDASLHSELWHDLTRRAPAEVRDTPATLLALSSWLNGRGAHAWVALDQVLDHEGNRLAQLVAQSLQMAVDPKIWDDVATSTPGLMQRTVLQDPINQQRQRDQYSPGRHPDQPDKTLGR